MLRSGVDRSLGADMKGVQSLLSLSELENNSAAPIQWLAGSDANPPATSPRHRRTSLGSRHTSRYELRNRYRLPSRSGRNLRQTSSRSFRRSYPPGTFVAGTCASVAVAPTGTWSRGTGGGFRIRECSLALLTENDHPGTLLGG